MEPHDGELPKHAGECLCGGIRYEISGDLPNARVCHCSICRKAFSGAGSYVAWLEPNNFSWRAGEELLKTYTDKRGLTLGFCSECGSTLCGIFEGMVACVTLGTLSGTPDIEIGAHIFVGSKAPWDEIGGDAPQFDEHPPARK